jgi:hypothetical protein
MTASFPLPAPPPGAPGGRVSESLSLFAEPSTARFSEDGEYRYALARAWPGGRGAVNFIMLNPSTATAELDDPTIRRCIGFARSWGYQRLVVTNLFALRSTDPAALRKHPDPVGPENAVAILEAAGAELVICAWGRHGELAGRGHTTARALALLDVPLKVLRLTAGGQPAHPLYLPGDLRPFRWGGAV